MKTHPQHDVKNIQRDVSTMSLKASLQNKDILIKIALIDFFNSFCHFTSNAHWKGFLNASLNARFLIPAFDKFQYADSKKLLCVLRIYYPMIFMFICHICFLLENIQKHFVGDTKLGVCQITICK